MTHQLRDHIGNGMGVDAGQFIAAAHWVFDKHTNQEVAPSSRAGRPTSS
jgi:hypothetical protein